MEEFSVTLNKRIKHYRKLAGYTQADVADCLGLRLSTYSQRERSGGIEVEFLIELAKLLDVDFTELALGKENVPPPKIIAVPIEISAPKPVEIPVPKKPDNFPKQMFTPTEMRFFGVIKNFSKTKKNCVYRFVEALYKTRAFK